MRLCNASVILLPSVSHACPICAIRVPSHFSCMYHVLQPIPIISMSPCRVSCIYSCHGVVLCDCVMRPCRCSASRAMHDPYAISVHLLFSRVSVMIYMFRASSRSSHYIRVVPCCRCNCVKRPCSVLFHIVCMPHVCHAFPVSFLSYPCPIACYMHAIHVCIIMCIVLLVVCPLPLVVGGLSLCACLCLFSLL